MPVARRLANILDPGRFATFRHTAGATGAAALASLVLAVAWLALAGGSARAAEDSVFTVKDVHVDRTAESAAAARDLALAEGQATAFRRLITRLVPRQEQSKVPVPSGGGIAQLVKDFQVAQEKTSSVRYIADMEVRFRPDAVQRLLRTAGVSFALTPSQPLVVLPVYRKAGALLLWDRINPWLQAWQALPPDGALVPLIVPPGDLSDIADISPEQALAQDEARISALARRYGAVGGLLAYAAYNASAGEDGPAVEVSIARIGGNAPERTLVRSISANPGENEASLLARAAVTLRSQLEEAWKRENLLRFDEQRRLDLVAPLAGIQDWVRLNRALGDIPLIERSELIQLTRDEATLRLSYLGDEQQLALAFAQRDFELARGPVGWVVRPRGAGGPAPAGGASPAPQ